jgi:hypothetical protein
LLLQKASTVPDEVAVDGGLRNPRRADRQQGAADGTDRHRRQPRRMTSEAIAPGVAPMPIGA